MKRRILIPILLLALAAASVIAVLAAGNAGTASDPLLSLSYLQDTVGASITAQAQTDINAALDPVYDSARGQLESSAGQTDPGGYSFAATALQRRLKRDDAVMGQLGTSFVLLAGEALVSSPQGGVVDVTTGTELQDGAALTANHRYLVADETAAAFRISGDTAVVQFEGPYLLSLSSQLDYNALADALFAMTLFQGDDTGYGSGYALERTATRLEGLIMFLRLIGEEDKALAYTGGHPFTDVPNWASCYAAYAYEHGYTEGISETLFGTNDVLTPQHYATFLLRALGYVEQTDFSWLTSVEDLRTLDVITQGEQELFLSRFTRAQVVYLSYVSLNARLNGSGSTLLERLIAQGIFSRSTANTAMGKISLSRL